MTYGISPQLYFQTDMFCDLPDLDLFRFRLDLAALECLRKQAFIYIPSYELASIATIPKIFKKQLASQLAS